MDELQHDFSAQLCEETICFPSASGFVGIHRPRRSGDLLIFAFHLEPRSSRRRRESSISFPFDMGQETVPAAAPFILSTRLSSDAVPPAVSWKLHG